MKKITYFLLAITILASCSVQKKSKNEIVIDDYKLARAHAVLYHQQSAEYKALCIQAYNAAKLALEKNLQYKYEDKKRAVVLDIDETVLDNSYYEAQCIKNNVSYPDLWEQWVKKQEATPIPGAKAFIDFAVANNVEVIYITNRKERYRQPTKDNLRKFDFPIDKDANLLMREEESSKVQRRNQITAEYQVVMFIGDNLNDFDGIFENEDNILREEAVGSTSEKFGIKYIVTPNALYGQWEQNMAKEMPKNNYKKSLVKKLRGFELDEKK